MIIKTIKLLFKNNASETEKDFQGLNDTLDDTAKANDKVNQSFKTGASFAERYGDEVEPLGSRLGQATDRLYELALAGDTTSQEYKDLIAETGRLRKTQIETDLAIEGASQTFSQKLAPALNGVTSGFAVTQGAMALFGKENEALEESLLKVQSALAIQQGIQGLTESYKQLQVGTKLASVAQAGFAFVTGGASTALKVFRLALISTGIGAIVVGLGLLIANFDKVKEAVTNVTKSFKEGGAVTKALMIAFAPLILTIKAVQKGLQLLGVTASEEEIEAEKREKASQQRYEAEKKRLEERKKQLEKQAQAQRDYTDAYLGELDIRRRMAKKNGDDIKAIDQEILETQIKSVEQEKKNFLEGRNIRLKELQALERRLLERYGANSAKYRDQVKINQKFAKRIRNEEFNEITVFNNQIQSLRLDNEDKEAESLERRRQKYQEYRDYRLQVARQIEDLQNDLLEEGIEKELEINADKFRRLREDAERNTKLTLQERKTLIDLFTQQEKQSELEIRQKYYDEEKSQALEFLNAIDELNNAEVEKEKAKNLAIVDSNIKAYKKKKELTEKEKADAIELQNTKIDLSVQGLQLIANIAETFAGDDEKRQRRAFQIKKVADIASATVDGYRAVLSTYAQTPGGPVVKGIAATIAGSFAALQIANIAKQQFQGGEGAGDLGADVPSGTQEAVAPQFNVVGDSGVNQLAQLQQQPLQAYVVSGEVTTSQALDRNRVENATL